MTRTTIGTTTSLHRPARARTRAHGKPNQSERPHAREHARTRPVELENRCGFRVTVGSNPTPSARNGHFPHSLIASSASQYHNAYHNQRRMAVASTGLELLKSAGARRDVTGPRPRVCPGVAALGEDGRSTGPAPAPRPLAPVSTRVARRGWGQWVDSFSDHGERAPCARTQPTATDQGQEQAW